MYGIKSSWKLERDFLFMQIPTTPKFIRQMGQRYNMDNFPCKIHWIFQFSSKTKQELEKKQLLYIIDEAFSPKVEGIYWGVTITKVLLDSLTFV